MTINLSQALSKTLHQSNTALNISLCSSLSHSHTLACSHSLSLSRSLARIIKFILISASVEPWIISHDHFQQDTAARNKEEIRGAKEWGKIFKQKRTSTCCDIHSRVCCTFSGRIISIWVCTHICGIPWLFCKILPNRVQILYYILKKENREKAMATAASEWVLMVKGECKGDNCLCASSSYLSFLILTSDFITFPTLPAHPQRKNMCLIEPCVCLALCVCFISRSLRRSQRTMNNFTATGLSKQRKLVVSFRLLICCVLAHVCPKELVSCYLIWLIWLNVHAEWTSDRSLGQCLTYVNDSHRTWCIWQVRCIRCRWEAKAGVFPFSDLWSVQILAWMWMLKLNSDHLMCLQSTSLYFPKVSLSRNSNRTSSIQF